MILFRPDRSVLCYSDIVAAGSFGFGCIVILFRPDRSALGVLSFASAKQSTKEKQPGKPFCEKVSRDSSKGEGHFR